MTSVDDRWTPPLPPPPQARRGPRILLGVTGSVAAIKAPALVCRLLRLTADGDTAHVKILLTAGGRNFWNRAAEYDPISWMQLQEHLPQPTNIKSDHADDLTSSQEPTPAQSIVVPPRIELHYAQDDWKAWERLGDPVEHIALRDWADILVVAPLSAHTLAKLSQGLCDDTLSCVFRAWDFGHSTTRTASSVNHAGGGGGKPVVLAPAMNTAMWEHPLTRQQLDRICSFWKESNESSSGGVTIVPPQSKLLACGDTGVGALADLDAIVQSVRDIILQQQQQRNQRYLDGTDSVPRIP